MDAVLAFDDPTKMFRLGIRAMERGFRFLGRTPETKKEEFMDVIRKEIDEGSPVIALGVIGPPEACIVTSCREGGSVLTGWNVFQEYPEYQARSNAVREFPPQNINVSSGIFPSAPPPFFQ